MSELVFSNADKWTGTTKRRNRNLPRGQVWQTGKIKFTHLISDKIINTVSALCELWNVKYISGCGRWADVWVGRGGIMWEGEGTARVEIWVLTALGLLPLCWFSYQSTSPLFSVSRNYPQGSPIVNTDMLQPVMFKLYELLEYSNTNIFACIIQRKYNVN